MNTLKNFVSFLLLFLLNSTIHAQTFQEISVQSGIDHSFNESLTIGGGVAFFDYDNDGDEDIYLNGGLDMDRLYQNNGDGTYTDVAFFSGLGLTANFYTSSVSTGDIDNDGYREIFIGTRRDDTNTEARSLFFKNNGDGTFIEMGVFAGFDHISWIMGTTFFDIDLDGLLDIYAVEYVENPGATNIDGQITFTHECYGNKLYKNNGDLTFTDVTDLYGVENAGCSLAAVASDYDLDGDQDLYLINDFGEDIIPNSFFQNQYPNSSFTDVGPSNGGGIALYGMGIASGDYNLDGYFDYYITNLGRNVLLEGNGTSFTDVATQAGVENTNTADTLLTTGWGAAFMDTDNDGLEDIFVANGRVPAAAFIATGELDPNKLYHNNGDGTFEDITDSAGVGDINRGRGMAYSDIDDDGDLDIIVSVQQGSFEPDAITTLYRNDNANNNNWVKFKLTGVLCNRDAYGAIVRCYVGDQTYIRELHGGSSHASQHSSVLHFGLGQAVKIDSVHVSWPGGDTQLVAEPAINQTHEITQEVGPLQQDLLAFSGKENKNSFLLQWDVANEENTKHYILQKSLNPASGVRDIATIPARNLGATTSVYQREDFAITKGQTYYYRLKIINADNSVKYSHIIAMKLDAAAGIPAVTVFPNPAQEHLSVHLDNFEYGQEIAVEIFSMAGQKVFAQSKNEFTGGSIPINIGDLPKSIYVIKVTDRGGQSFFDQFIKQ